MNPFERKVVHDAISELDGVQSESEGDEPQRRVVVHPSAEHDPSVADPTAVPAMAPQAEDPIAAAVRSAARAVFGDALPLVERYADAGRRRRATRADRPEETPQSGTAIWSIALSSQMRSRSVLASSMSDRVPDYRGSSWRVCATICTSIWSTRKAAGPGSWTKRYWLEPGRSGSSVHRPRGGTALRAAIGPSSWMTARAVAPLDRLARWCLPLLEPGGTLVALKGSTAETELAEVRGSMTRLGIASAEVREYGGGSISPTNESGGDRSHAGYTCGDGTRPMNDVNDVYRQSR